MQNRIFQQIAKSEPLLWQKIKKHWQQGKIVIPKNPRHKKLKPLAIGKDLKIKINANIGKSNECSSLKEEMKKLKIVEKYGADAVMDLSVGQGIRKYRQAIIKATSLCFGTVPIYEAVEDCGGIYQLNIKNYLETLKKHGEDGVDFVTIHAGLRRKFIPHIKKRLTGVVSRGGSFLYRWMKRYHQENFLYTYFDEILKVCKKYSMTISLGDALRPGSIADNTDQAQIGELKELGKLVLRCKKARVQVMVEGPGHVPINKIEQNVKLQKKYCYGAPFYVLGPLVTDIAPGYDHITAAIGGAWAGYFGTDFLCYVTPAEHLGLPSLEDVKEGVIASKIAAHAADIAHGIDGEWDKKLSAARKKFQWDKQAKLCLDPEKFKKYRNKKSKNMRSCSMCGKYCAMYEN